MHNSTFTAGYFQKRAAACSIYSVIIAVFNKFSIKSQSRFFNCFLSESVQAAIYSFGLGLTCNRCGGKNSNLKKGLAFFSIKCYVVNAHTTDGSGIPQGSMGEEESTVWADVLFRDGFFMRRAAERAFPVDVGHSHPASGSR